MIWLLRPTWNVPLNVYLLESFDCSVVLPRPVIYAYLSFNRQLVKNHAFCLTIGPPRSPLRSYCFFTALPPQTCSPARSKQRPVGRREKKPSSSGVLACRR